MSNYEFWDELGKIFNAVVAYQEKTIEFNKRFINPWIRLGNVFDKQDRNKEAVSAYEKAIEIDPDNAQNWYELGNVHFKMGHYEDAIAAFNKAIELEPGFGWAYSNLALTLVSQGKHMQAIPLYRKSIDLLAEDKDKAVAWNRLGNVYRKLNEYALAVDAFQKADDLDHENAGFRDNLDEAPEAPTIEANGDTPVTLSPSELILAEGNAAEEAASQNIGQPESVPDGSTEAGNQPAAALPEAAEQSADSASDTVIAVESVEIEPELEASASQAEIVAAVETSPVDSELEPAASQPEAIAAADALAVEPEAELDAPLPEPIDAVETVAVEPELEPAASPTEVVEIVETVASEPGLELAASEPEPVVVETAAAEPELEPAVSASEVFVADEPVAWKQKSRSLHHRPSRSPQLRQLPRKQDSKPPPHSPRSSLHRMRSVPSLKLNWLMQSRS